jgi:hypothetical protein
MKLWTNNTNAVTVVDDNKLWPRCSYILPDELVNPPFTDGIPSSAPNQAVLPRPSRGWDNCSLPRRCNRGCHHGNGCYPLPNRDFGGCSGCLLPCPQYALCMLGWERGCCPCHQRLRRGLVTRHTCHSMICLAGKVGGTELGTGPGNHYDRIYLVDGG